MGRHGDHRTVRVSRSPAPDVEGTFKQNPRPGSSPRRRRLTPMEPERIELVSARARPVRDLLSVVAGLSAFGLMISLIGWINLYATPRRLTDAPLEGFFGAVSSLFVILVLLVLPLHP